MPVGLHVRPLQFARTKGNLTCVAGERVGGLDIRLGRHLLRGHDAGLWERRGVEGEDQNER